MSERVIYCDPDGRPILGSARHEVLHQFADGMVIAVQDETVLLAPRSPFALLYFSRAAYENATQALTSAQLDAVVRKRREQWAPNVTGRGLSWIYHQAQQCLTLTAVAQASSTGLPSTRFKEHFEQILQLLVVISGESRYQDLSLASVLVLVIEGEGQLYREYLDAEDVSKRTAARSAAQWFAAAAKRSQDYGRALGPLLKNLGRPEFTQGLPYVGLGRTVFVSPRDAALLKNLTSQREAHVAWKDGVVVSWSLDDLTDLTNTGKSTRILYFNTGQFRLDLKELTSAQAEREFAKRLEAGWGGSMEARRQYLYNLWLEQHLLRRKAHTKAAATGTATILAAQIAEETQVLQQELAAHPVWWSNGGKQTGSAIEALKTCEEQLLQDARFLAALCRRDEDEAGEALYKRISSFKPAQP